MRFQKINKTVKKLGILTPDEGVFLFLKALNRKFWAKYFKVYGN